MTNMHTDPKLAHVAAELVEPSKHNAGANQAVTLVVLAECKRLGITRAELARRLGQRPAWVTQKLNGHRRWTVDDLDLLAERLEMPLAALLLPPAPIRGEVVALHTGRYDSRIRWRNMPRLAETCQYAAA
jgi:transcriptional regulator with XRE-family HTH domain